MPKSRGRRRPAPSRRPPGRSRPPAAPTSEVRQPVLTRMRADVPQSTGFRRRVERRSALMLAYLAQLPRLVVGVVVLAMALIGMLGPAWLGGVVLLAVGLVLLWLTYVSWPGVRAPARLVRLAATTLVLGLGLWRLVG